MQPNSRRPSSSTNDRGANDERMSPPPLMVPSPPPPIPHLPSSLFRRSIPAVLVSPSSRPRPASPRPVAAGSRIQNSDSSPSAPAAASESRRRLSLPRSRFMYYPDRVAAARVQPQSAILSGPDGAREDEEQNLEPLPEPQYPTEARAVAPAIPPHRDPPPSYPVGQLKTLDDLARARTSGPWIVVYAYRHGQHRYRAGNNNNILEA